jgi:hypothetical protein
MNAELPTRPLYRREYEALGEQGFFADEKVELLDGRIVYAAEEGSPHAAVTRRLNRLLVEAIPAEEGEVGVGNPLAISDLSEPEPDFMVVAPAATYRTAHPTTARLGGSIAASGTSVSVFRISQSNTRRQKSAVRSGSVVWSSKYITRGIDLRLFSCVRNGSESFHHGLHPGGHIRSRLTTTAITSGSTGATGASRSACQRRNPSTTIAAARR